MLKGFQPCECSECGLCKVSEGLIEELHDETGISDYRCVALCCVDDLIWLLLGGFVIL